MLNKIDWESRIGRRFRMRDLHVFSTVVQCGSMARAARQLRVSQPAVSEVVANLEHAVGARLLDRSPSGIETTIYGDALLKRIVVVFDELTQGVRDIEFLSDPAVGELRIGCTESLSATIVPQIIARFSREYPYVVVHLDDVSDRAVETVGPGLRERKYDCVLQRIVTPLPDAAHDLHAEVLFDDQLAVVTGEHTSWARRRKVELAELVREPWILPPVGTWYHSAVSRIFTARGLAVPKASLIVHAVALRARLLADGRYLTTFARSVVRSNAERYGLTCLRVDVPPQPLPAGILTLKDRTLSPIVARFMEIARAVARRRR